MMQTLRAAGISFASGHPTAYTAFLADHPNVELIGVAEVPGATARSDMAAEFARRRGVPHWDDYVEMLDREAPDIVSLCVVPDRNPEVIRACAERGIHILSEKPLAMTLEDGEKALDVVEKSGVVFSLDIPNGCFTRPLEDAHAMARSGALGDIRVVYCQYLQNRGPRYTYAMVDGKKVPPQYGELPNFGPYGFLAASLATGQRMTSVFARRDVFFYEHYREAGHEDMCLASVTFEGGAVANIVIGRTPTKSLPTTDFRLEIIGSEGSVFVDDAMGDKGHVWGPYTQNGDPYEGGGLDYAYYSPVFGRHYIDDVVNAVLNGTQPRIGVDQARDCFRFIDGCCRSAETGQPVTFGGK